jgi:hypothetical protein
MLPNSQPLDMDSVKICTLVPFPHFLYPMMNPKSYSGDIICRPSQFLEDFPAELVEEW